MIRLKRLYKSFNYAFKGLRKAFREEQNLRVQSVFALAVLLLGFAFGIGRLEWMVLFIAIGLVILMELLNSAVERVTDVLKPRLNGYVKEIKDIMAAAVMLSSAIALILGILVFWPYIMGP